MTARRVNISTPERIVRVVGGTAAAVLGIVLLASGPAAPGLVGALLLAALGLDFAVTGAIGYCPLYARLGHTPRSLREQTR